MDARELDVLVAEKVMGWTREGKLDHTRPAHRPSKDYPGKIINDFESKGPHDYLCFPGYRDKYVAMCGCDNTLDMPKYSTEILDLFLVQSRMKELKLIERYGIELGNLLFDSPPGIMFHIGGRGLFSVANASPRERCIAALRSVGVTVA